MLEYIMKISHFGLIVIGAFPMATILVTFEREKAK
jgi:hypothetical protein